MRLCLFGAAGDTGNLGVSALLHSIVVPLHQRIPDLDLLTFDTRESPDPTRTVDIDGSSVSHRVGVVRSGRRYWRSDNLTTLSILQRIGLPAPVLSEIRDADAVLDISGGDSFTDIYGPKRFHQIVAPKLLALRAGTPLLLLPQTYGEFHHRSSSDIASRIVSDPLTHAWSRDDRSHALLSELADATTHAGHQMTGVDVAFGLQPVPRHDLIPPDLAEWIRPGRPRPVAGVNVSGLLYNDPSAAGRYGLSVDYREVMKLLVERLLRESDANVLLVPHVNPQPADEESDPRACDHLLQIFSPEFSDRILRAPAFDQPGAAKWLIGSLDWFTGSRMHSTIAALSSDVPAAALSYSMKTVGVFASCDMESATVDGRSESTGSAVESLWRLWLDRRAQAEVLRRGAARARGAADAQMDDIVSLIMRFKQGSNDRR